MPQRYLTMRAVAEMEPRCAHATVREAIMRGELQVTSEHIGAAGDVTSCGIALADAKRWKRRGIRNVGRPKSQP